MFQNAGLYRMSDGTAPEGSRNGRYGRELQSRAKATNDALKTALEHAKARANADARRIEALINRNTYLEKEREYYKEETKFSQALMMYALLCLDRVQQYCPKDPADGVDRNLASIIPSVVLLMKDSLRGLFPSYDEVESDDEDDDEA